MPGIVLAREEKPALLESTMYAERVIERAPSSSSVRTTKAPGFGLVLGLSLAGLIVTLLASAYFPIIAVAVTMGP